MALHEFSKEELTYIVVSCLALEEDFPQVVWLCQEGVEAQFFMRRKKASLPNSNTQKGKHQYLLTLLYLMHLIPLVIQSLTIRSLLAMR
jgi:hypothetical protein